MLLLDCSRQYEVLADYERRFGPLDHNGTALCYLVAQMLAAIDGNRDPLDRSSVENAEKAYATLMMRKSLRRAFDLA